MEAIGLLVAGVAHELNNPLASIVAFSQLLRTDPDLPPDLRSQAELLVQEADRTRSIVGNLLDFARQRPPERVELDLRPVVDGVIALQSYMLARNRVTVDVDIPADLPPLSVDRSQLQQVLVNLTVNAAQAIHDADRAGRVTIRAASAERDGAPIVRIEVADDGPGVPAAVSDRLFVPFVTTKPPGAGTGLGLSVSFGIVAATAARSTTSRTTRVARRSSSSCRSPGATGGRHGAEAPRRVGARPDDDGGRTDGPHERARQGPRSSTTSLDPRLPRARPRRGRLRAVLAATGQEALEIVRSDRRTRSCATTDGRHERHRVPRRRRRAATRRSAGSRS
jgi:hypothetical protein